MLSNNDKSADSSDPQFLTFRHNSPDAMPISGRSIYSQRFDYKSLQKYPIFDTHNSYRQQIHDRTYKKIKHPIQQKNMRTVKSQQKYKQIICNKYSNAQQINYYEGENEMGRDDKGMHRNKYQRNNGSANRSRRQDITDRNQPVEKLNSHQILQKNIELKSQLCKLIRKIKKEQRAEVLYEQEVASMEQEIDSYDRQLEEQERNIIELQQINQENMKQCNRIIDHIRAVRTKNQQMAASLQNLEESVDSSQISIETSKQEEKKDRILCTKLRETVNNLNKTKSAIEQRVHRLEQQVQRFQSYMDQLKAQQMQIIKIFGFQGDLSSVHNYSVHSLSQNHSHSHNSSSGSNRENTYYY